MDQDPENREKRVIFIHIAFPEAVSSDIRLFLYKNRTLLRDEGYYYPDEKNAAHLLSVSAGARRSGGSSGEDRDIPGIFPEKVNDSWTGNVILSVEISGSDPSFPGRLKEVLEKGIPGFSKFRVIASFRRQDYWLESLYQTRITDPFISETKPFVEFVRDQEEKGYPLLNFQQVLEPWAAVFGRGNICVHAYDDPPGTRPMEDFLSDIGCGNEKRENFQKFSGPGSRLTRDMIEIVRICNSGMEKNANFSYFLTSNLNRIALQNPVSQDPYLSPADRIRLIERFDRINQSVAREYQGRPDGPLFSASMPDPGMAWEPYPGLTMERLIPIVIQVLYNIYRDYNRRIWVLERKKDPFRSLLWRISQSERWYLKGPVRMINRIAGFYRGAAGSRQ
jgi:hypothetical protein